MRIEPATVPALHPTRRRILGGIAATVLAGCAGDSTESTTVEDEPHDPLAGPPPEATTEFEVRSLRAPLEEPFVSFGGEDETRDRRARGLEFVLDDEAATTLEFDVERDDVEHDDVEAMRSFLEATDYETESIVVHQLPIEACYDRRVEHVTVQPDRYRVQFCRELREATTPCSADETEMEALFIRVPHAYDSAPSSRGSGERSRCHSDFWDEGDRE